MQKRILHLLVINLFLMAVVCSRSAYGQNGNCLPVNGANIREASISLLANADEQIIFWNGKECPIASPQWFTLVTGGSSPVLKIKMKLEPIGVPAGSSTRSKVRVTQIVKTTPDSLKSGHNDWAVYSSESLDSASRLGTVSITFDLISVKPALRVIANFRSPTVPVVQDSAVKTEDGAEIGIAASTPSPVRNGSDTSSPVPNDPSSEDPSNGFFDNVAYLSIPNFVRERAKYWQVRNPSWGSELHLTSNIKTLRDDECTKDSLRCPTESIAELHFHTHSTQSTPLTVDLIGYEDGAASGSNPVVQISRLRLASEARKESIVMPLRQLAMVLCRYKYSTLPVSHNSIVGVYDKDIESQTCSLVIPRWQDVISKKETDAQREMSQSSAGKKDSRIHRKRAEQLAKEAADLKSLLPTVNQQVLEIFERNAHMYGPQRIQIKITQDGESSTDTWIYDPNGNSDEWPLRVKNFKSSRNQSSIYEIEAAIIDKADKGNVDGVSYQFGTTSQNDRVFSCQLRPTGLFALPRTSNLRIFVTVPVDVTAIRFPGSAIDLRRSSANPLVQVQALKAGLLFGFEPWDYDRGKTLWPIPVRFLVGFHAVDLITTYFSPSLLAGVSLTVPVIESSSLLSTSLALGAFYGYDLREPKEVASHFLLTLGFNFFSLFGAKAK